VAKTGLLCTYEFNMLKKLGICEHVIPLIGFTRRDNTFMMLLKYIKVKKQKPSSEPEFRNYMRKLLRGLNAIHTKGMIHRDIKPENVLVSCNERLYVIDFQVATSVPWRGRSYGTMGYMAPEQFNSELICDYAVDMWSTGIILAEMILKKSFLGTKDVHCTIVEQICRFQSKHPSLSVEMIDLVLQMLQIDPKKRISCQRALDHPWIKVVEKEKLEGKKDDAISLTN